jgi:uncharacterized protein (DUF1015 family)
MSRVRPFVGLLFDRSVVGSLDVVTTPPYDVISDTDRLRFLGASPYNVIRLDLGRSHGGDDDEDDQYRRAASDLRSWREARALVPTPGPSYYVYEMRFSLHGASRTILGLVCAVDIEDPGGAIVPHERTLEAPIEDRLRLMRAVRANVSCIQTVCDGPNEALATFLDDATRSEPAARTVDEAGVRHRLWVVPPDPRVAGWLASETLMIADGHHRYATALRFRDEMRASEGPGPWDRVMALVVDASVQDPPVLPFHRVQTGGSAHRAGRRVRDLAELLECLHEGTLRYGIVAIEDDVLVHRIAELEGEPPVVAALHDRVLDRLDADLRYTPDAAEAEAAVRDRSAVAAYVLPPADAREIRAVIERGDRLPPKSTFFWPKPRSGLVIRCLDLDADAHLPAEPDRADVSRPRPAPAS